MLWIFFSFTILYLIHAWHFLDVKDTKTVRNGDSSLRAFSEVLTCWRCLSWGLRAFASTKLTLGQAKSSNAIPKSSEIEDFSTRSFPRNLPAFFSYLAQKQNEVGPCWAMRILGLMSLALLQSMAEKNVTSLRAGEGKSWRKGWVGSHFGD